MGLGITGLSKQVGVLSPIGLLITILKNRRLIMKRRILTALVATLTLSACTSPTLLISKIGLNESVVSGRNAEIDAGYVVSWDGCYPHEGCTIHLLGHRSTHGSVFARIPELYPGDTFNVYMNGHSHSYRVTRRRLVSRSVGFDAIYGDAVIQTSMYDNYVLLLYADRR